MNRFILHLGYPKTGTTYLQRKIFSQLIDSFIVITPESENCKVNIKRLMYAIHGGTVPEKTRNKFAGHNVLLSLEGLLLESMRNIRNGRFAPMSWLLALEGLQSFASDIANEDFSIVLYLRQQDELLHSLYAESKTFHFSQCTELDTLEKYVNAVIAEDQISDSPGYHYDFNNTVDEIKKSFPNNNLHIRFFEDLERNPEEEIAFWSELCGQPLHLVTGKENARRMGNDEKLADQNNWFRFTLLRFKNKYLPALKLPSKLSLVIKKVLSKTATAEQESIMMTSIMRSRLRAKYSLVNARQPVGDLIPEHLRRDYLVPEIAEQSVRSNDH